MTVQCPVPTCRADNDGGAEVCARCGTPLAAYGTLVAHAACLFNAGLDAARAGQLLAARESFAATVLWCPHDVEARNALALACYQTGDLAAALAHWRLVLRRAPHNELATKGVAAIERAAPRAGGAAPVKPSSGGSGGHRRRRRHR